MSHIANKRPFSNTAKGPGVKGSKMWIQKVIENPILQNALNDLIGEPLKWLSPLAGPLKTYDEYQLKETYVCEHLGVQASDVDKLYSFWPKAQPQWDGLALDETGTVLYIVEAKAHLKELESQCKATSPASRSLILDSMKKVQLQYYPHGCFKAWVDAFYQLGNRLTFLRKLNEKPFGNIKKVKLVLLNFANDYTHHSTTEEAWAEHYKTVWSIMTGLPNAPEDVIVVNYDVS